MTQLPLSRRTTDAIALAFFVALAGCGGGSGSVSAPMPHTIGSNAAAGMPATDTDTSVDHTTDHGVGSDLRRLANIVTIGSTVVANGEQNPYGLDVAKSSSGPISAGDLVVCNFNDAANVQGTGSTIIALHPQPGSTPTEIAQDPSLLGCTAVALAPNDNIWTAAFAANDNPIVSPGGTVLTTLTGGPWSGPFGQTFAPHAGAFGVAAFYESNATDGSIVRIGIMPGPSFNFTTIATGFAVNGGAPGSILGPSGLQYDARHDRLYIVDGANNSVVALKHVSTIPANGITANGLTFSGPFRKRARVVFSGTPLNGPISSALLPDGRLVIGNTLDPNGENLMVEIAQNGRLIDVRNVDTGAAGAIFGMVATGHDRNDEKLYFNDDNTNTVVVLER